MKNDELREACLAYFRSMPVFERLLSQFCEKYRSYGCFCGSARLNIRSEDEREALEGFFARSYHNQKTATISAQAFRRALEHTRFVELSPEEILEAFAGAPLSGKREEESRRKACIARCWKATIGQQEAYADCEASRQLLHELRAVAEKEEPAISSEDVPSIGAIDNTAHTCTSEEAVTALYRQLMSGRQEVNVRRKMLEMQHPKKR